MLPVTIERLLVILQTKGGINFGHDRMYVMPYHISWTIFTLALVLSYTVRQIVGMPTGTYYAPHVAILLYLL